MMFVSHYRHLLSSKSLNLSGHECIYLLKLFYVNSCHVVLPSSVGAETFSFGVLYSYICSYTRFEPFCRAQCSLVLAKKAHYH